MSICLLFSLHICVISYKDCWAYEFYYDDDEFQQVKDVFETGWFSSGPKVEEFEKRMANYVGSTIVKEERRYRISPEVKAEVDSKKKNNG